MTVRLGGLAVLFLYSAPAAAESFFSRFQYRSFSSDVLPIILMCTVAIVATWWLRKKIRRSAASAPKESLRSPQERRLHNLSRFFIIAPVLYSFFLNVDLVFPVFALLWTQGAVLIGLRALGMPFRWRLACILPVGLLSVVAGEIVASWPVLTPSFDADLAWALTTCAISFALGSLLSYLSCPPAYRARMWG